MSLDKLETTITSNINMSLTKDDIIDLMINNERERLEAEIKKLQKQLADLSEEREKEIQKIAVSKFNKLFPNMKYGSSKCPYLNLEGENFNHKLYPYDVFITVRIPSSKKQKIWDKYRNNRNLVEEKLYVLNSELLELKGNSRKLKSKLLISVLNKSDEGKRILDLVKGAGIKMLS